MTLLGTQERIEELLRKSLLGEELIDTQFHLFSATTSSRSGRRRIVRPRVLCANNVLLAKSSKYFVDLLSSDINSSDASLSDLADDHDVPNEIQIDEYGYASDSDLDEAEEPSIPAADAKTVKDPAPASESTSPSDSSPRNRLSDDDGLSDTGSESDNSDIFVMSPEHPKLDETFFSNVDGTISIASTETINHAAPGNMPSAGGVAMRLRSLGSRHILVKDTAFKTWFTLLNYLYTGKFNFLPLTSTISRLRSAPAILTNFTEEPKCSAKSMYRLACKVGLDHLREEALAHIRRNLSEHNIIEELSCSLLSRHPELLELALDVLYAHISSPPVVGRFATFAQRIANNELRHGADIILGIHSRVLKERQSIQSPLAPVIEFVEEVTPLESPPRSTLPDIGEPVASTAVQPGVDKVVLADVYGIFPRAKDAADWPGPVASDACDIFAAAEPAAEDEDWGLPTKKSKSITSRPGGKIKKKKQGLLE